MESYIKTLIVDDELYSRDELKFLLQSYPNIQIIGEAESGESAIMKAIQLQPDVVFLDVEMPRMSGIEAAKALNELKKPPLVVFATAYPQFAVEAFRYDAIDYLLKPFDENQLKETVERIERKLGMTVQSQDQGGGKPTGKLAVESEGEIFYLDPSEILYIFRDDKVTKIIAKSGEYEMKTPLKDLESRLSMYDFFRIHKGYLVNLKYITKLTPWFNGAYQLKIEGRKELLSVSRNYVKALRKKLEI
ncbi:LytR/AlgR family response regulator transcription factor [Calidifontibacillus erzurumensis]|uniref:Response regulator transcription factor n=1 Tax=Calidifontibacillus erzurumensis TaxID=2741433 RepID=A0A8J8GJE1_9BACI|nr:LytTR family DNA-binding domain-containing protein [Calidifontibacillus erzurumensis]NSL52843.1 response regulator transcription factor [Calidifontibacillus erzurumensis]